MSKLTSLLTTLFFALVALTPACKGDEKASDGKAQEASEKGSASSSAEIFIGKKPSIPGPLAGLAFGMDEAAAKKAVPALFADEVREYGATRVADGPLGDSYAGVTFTSGALTEVKLSVETSALEQAKKAWGDGEEIKWGASDKVAHCWFDETSGVRAVLTEAISDGLDLIVSPYMTYEQLASLGDDALPLNPRVALGATAKQLVDDLPRYVKPSNPDSRAAKRTEAMMKDMKKDLEAKGIKLGKSKPGVDAHLPPTQYADSNTLVSIHFNDAGRVRGMTVMLKANDITKLGKDLKAAFDKAWGESKVLDKTLGKTHFWYDEENGVRASARLDEKYGINLEFVRYMPLATLFGEKGATWGFEKTALIGATIDELKAAFGDTFVVDDKGEGGHLEYPVTDYGDNVSTTNIYLRMKQGKVSGYRFDLEYEPYPEAKAEMEAMLVAKFGEPKKGKRDSTYNKKPKISVRDSDITKKLYFEAE